MNRVGIIGLGTISKYYKDALSNSPFFNLVAVCDKVSNPTSIDTFIGVDFFNDYKQMIKSANIDYVIICTPPKTHYEIANYALNNGVSVLVEKPAVLDLKSFDLLLETAKNNNLVFDVILHWQTGAEVLGFNQNFSKDKIQGIEIYINDNYSLDGKTINPEKLSLEGTWVDSGVNALSMLKLWFNFDTVTVVDKKMQLCKNSNLPIMCDISLTIDGTPVRIKIDWRNGETDKYSRFIYDGKPMLVSSTNQAITYDGKVYDFATINRLQAHYTNFFKNFNGKSNGLDARKIHEVLFTIRDI